MLVETSITNPLFFLEALQMRIFENPSEGSNRAGRYIRQLSGYRAFMPAPLPPELPIRIAGELQVLLSQADRESVGTLED